MGVAGIDKKAEKKIIVLVEGYPIAGKFQLPKFERFKMEIDFFGGEEGFFEGQNQTTLPPPDRRGESPPPDCSRQFSLPD
jgi:hypothetical protein